MRISKDKRSYAKFAGVNEHDEFLSRISKTLYYNKLPVTDCLSLPVTELAAEIFTEVKNGKTLERLDVEEASRISRNACVSPCSLVLALLYLERLKDCNPEYLQRVAPSELFLVSLMVASKFLHDDGEDDDVYNAEWAQSGHLSCGEMNRLEKDFLKAINWSVYVHKHDFWKRLQWLEKEIAIKEARKRGWFSYTELNTLFDGAHVLMLLNTLLGVSSLCIATYAASLVTLLGSAVVAVHLPSTLISLKEQSQNLASGITNIYYPPSNNVSNSEELDEKIEDSILTSIFKESEICNRTSEIKNIFKSNMNSRTVGNGWDWIMDSTSIWPSNSVNSRTQDHDYNWNNQLNQNQVYITKTDLMIESDTFLQYSNDKIHNFGEKQAHDLSLKISLHDLKSYSKYFSKILSHGQ